MAELKDSGARREFETGAVRDMAEGKGNFYLMPLDVVAEVIAKDNDLDLTTYNINAYKVYGAVSMLKKAIYAACEKAGMDIYTAMIEASKQFEDGAKKYGENNWQKGIPMHSFIDSAERHYLQFLRGDADEPHFRAVLWNLLCAMWTHKHKPEMIDLPFAKREDQACV